MAEKSAICQSLDRGLLRQGNGFYHALIKVRLIVDYSTGPSEILASPDTVSFRSRSFFIFFEDARNGKKRISEKLKNTSNSLFFTLTLECL